jgi:hypothetical protein
LIKFELVGLTTSGPNLITYFPLRAVGDYKNLASPLEQFLANKIVSNPDLYKHNSYILMKTLYAKTDYTIMVQS